MSVVKRIVCLANSVKIGGSCIAGREILANGEYGGWIRPVSARPTAELSFLEPLYEDNASPQLLDIIDVPLRRAVPHNHQTENYEIDATKRWLKKGRLPWGELGKLCEHPTSLWINSDHTGSGIFDCISQSEAAMLNNSLMLLRSKDFTVEVSSKTWDGKTKKTYRGNFDYNGTYHSVSLTDPVATSAFASRGAGKYQLNDVYLCVSLTEPWEKDNNRCYKLVASIISNPPL